MRTALHNHPQATEKAVDYGTLPYNLSSVPLASTMQKVGLGECSPGADPDASCERRRGRGVSE